MSFGSLVDGSFVRSIRALRPFSHSDIRRVGNIILTPTNQSPIFERLRSDAGGRRNPDLWVPRRVNYRLRHGTTRC
jgi:hypothetical protein